MSDTPLTTVTAVQEYLGLAAGTDGELLTTMIARASAAICSYCGCEFAAADYDEYYDGDGTDSVVLQQRPVIEMTTLSEDGSDIAAEDYVVYAQTGIVRLKSGSFGRGAGTIRAQYWAGYETIPGDVEQAAIEWTAALYQSRETGGRTATTERVGDYAVTHATTEGAPANVRAALEPYRGAISRPVR